MSTVTINSSYLSTTIKNNPSNTASSDTPLIVGLTTGCFIIAAIVICILFCLGRRYELCAGCLIKKKTKKKTESQLTSVTMPSLPSPVVIHNLVEKKLPLVEHDKPKVVAHRADPKPTPSLHLEKSREINAKPCKPHRPDSCSQNICKQYSINLKMNKAYFNFRYNKCFCSQCYPITKADYFTVAGSIYTVPRHWIRFGLQIDQTFAESKQIFKQWYTTFYGTSKGKLESIINNRFVPMPGDHLLSNEIFTTRLSDKHHVYTSPSIKYACLKHVCPVDIVNIHSEWYDVQIILECKQNPEGIVKQHGYRQNVCNIIPDNEIEWKTDRRASIIPYGLLIHVQKHRCTKECINIHS